MCKLHVQYILLFYSMFFQFCLILKGSRVQRGANANRRRWLYELNRCVVKRFFLYAQNNERLQHLIRALEWYLHHQEASETLCSLFPRLGCSSSFMSIKNGLQSVVLYQRHSFLRICLVAVEWTLSICLFLLKQFKIKRKMRQSGRPMTQTKPQ